MTYKDLGKATDVPPCEGYVELRYRNCAFLGRGLPQLGDTSIIYPECTAAVLQFNTTFRVGHIYCFPGHWMSSYFSSPNVMVTQGTHRKSFNHDTSHKQRRSPNRMAISVLGRRPPMRVPVVSLHTC